MGFLLGSRGLDGEQPLSPHDALRVSVAGLDPRRVHFAAWLYRRGLLHEGQPCATCRECWGAGVLANGYLCPTCDRQVALEHEHQRPRARAELTIDRDHVSADGG